MNRKEIQLLMDFVNDSRKFFSNKLASDENDADWKIIFFYSDLILSDLTQYHLVLILI